MADSALPPSSFGAGYPPDSKSLSGTAFGPAPVAGLNKLAVASFVLALFVGVLAPLTIVMAHLARTQIRRSGQPGAGLAKAAFIISCVYIAAGAVVVALYLSVVGPT